MRRTRIESFKTWRGGFTYLIIRKGLYKNLLIKVYGHSIMEGKQAVV